MATQHSTRLEPYLRQLPVVISRSFSSRSAPAVFLAHIKSWPIAITRDGMLRSAFAMVTAKFGHELSLNAHRKTSV